MIEHTELKELFLSKNNKESLLDSFYTLDLILKAEQHREAENFCNYIMNNFYSDTFTLGIYSRGLISDYSRILRGFLITCVKVQPINCHKCYDEHDTSLCPFYLNFNKDLGSLEATISVS